VGGETRVSDDLVPRAGHAARGLAPGYFALVMASGIISLGLHLEGLRRRSSPAWVAHRRRRPLGTTAGAPWL